MNTPLIDESLLRARLATLRGETSSGERLLAELEGRAATLRAQLLRMDGAIRVLEELVATRHAGVRESVHADAS